jgi:hypothetical protein
VRRLEHSEPAHPALLGALPIEQWLFSYVLLSGRRSDYRVRYSVWFGRSRNNIACSSFNRPFFYLI